MQVYVAQDFALEDSLTNPIDYFTQVELSSMVVFEDNPSITTLAQLRDAVVAAAKADKRISDDIPSHEFLLRVSGGVYIVGGIEFVLAT